MDFSTAEALHNVECVVHLAGETVAQRWTPSVKASIRSSRIDGLKLITEACASLDLAPRIISASAIGGYRSSDQVQSESASFGEGFIEHTLCATGKRPSAPWATWAVAMWRFVSDWF